MSFGLLGVGLRWVWGLRFKAFWLDGFRVLGLDGFVVGI